MPADPNTADIISAAAAVVSATGGAFAAWAAFHSASHAKQSSLQAADVERRLLARQIVATAHWILADIHLANSLGETYLGTQSAQASAAHEDGTSDDVERRRALESQLQALNRLQPEVEKIRDEHHVLASASMRDLSALLSKVDGYASKARLACEDIARRLRDHLDRLPARPERGIG